MNMLADELSRAASRWWQSKEFADVTFNEVTEPAEDKSADYQIVRELEFRTAARDALSVSACVYDNRSFGLALLWRSQVRCLAGFEMGGRNAESFGVLLDLVSAGRFLIDQRGALLRLAGFGSKAVLNAEDARPLIGFGPKGWLLETDDVLPWRRAKLIQTTGWR